MQEEKMPGPIAAPRIPNLSGIKFTLDALADFQEALEFENGRCDMLWGRGEMLLGALATGVRVGVGTARQLQARAIAMINAMAATGHFFVALKSMLRENGVPIASRVRLPMTTPPEDAFAVPAIFEDQ